MDHTYEEVNSIMPLLLQKLLLQRSIATSHYQC